MPWSDSYWPMLNYTSPQLCSSQDCHYNLNFQPRAYWPEGLPGVAVNQYVIAGFAQKLILNHSIKNPQQMVELFCSLHSDLTFIELIRLSEVAKNINWFPLTTILKNYHLDLSTANQWIPLIKEIPPGFQDWCSDKRVRAQDLSPLLSHPINPLHIIFHSIIAKSLTKSDGIMSLEYSVDLSLIGHDLNQLKAAEEESGQNWLQRLKKMRYPNAVNQDEIASAKLSELHLPQSTQAKWVRHGDRAGIELKIFVSSPQQFSSLEKIQTILEENSEDLWTKH